MLDFVQIANQFIASISAFLPKLVAAIAFWIIGSFVINILFKSVKKILDKKDFDPSLESFLLSFLKLGLRVMLFAIIIGILGVQTTSFAAMLAGIGVALGSAFNGSLGNFAGGIMLMLYKPISVGDFIEFGANSGAVTAIGIFNTTILTGDCKTVYLPNGTLSTGVIVNWSRHGYIRVDVPLNIESNSNVHTVKEICIKAMLTHPLVLKTPQPEILIMNIAQGSTQLSIRSYCLQKDYWDVFNDTHFLILDAFKENGIIQGIPKSILISKES
jgi:small conductance mechanosensitive channel